MIEKIKVLVVDDSAFMRKSLSLLMESDPNIKVIDTARDGLDGYEKIKLLKPDIVTLDIEMPKMDGLTALQKIMTECPVPVIMISSLTTEGASETIKALELGAVDFISKSSSYVNFSISGIKQELIKKVKEIHNNKNVLKKLRSISSYKNSQANNKLGKLPALNYKALAIGISTGGPISLQKVIPYLSEKINIPIFIVQHMPPKFTASLAERLNSLSPLRVKEAEEGEVVENGVVYIAQGGRHMTFFRDKSNNVIIQISDDSNNVLHKPSVDIMFESAQAIYGKNMLGVIMTGMGKDGFEAIKKLKQIGGHCIAQDEKTCVVYGMPRVIVANGLADLVVPLEDIPKIINEVM